jgi:hypothetical protein
MEYFAFGKGVRIPFSHSHFGNLQAPLKPHDQRLAAEPRAGVFALPHPSTEGLSSPPAPRARPRVLPLHLDRERRSSRSGTTSSTKAPMWFVSENGPSTIAADGVRCGYCMRITLSLDLAYRRAPSRYFPPNQFSQRSPLTPAPSSSS